MVNFKHYLRGGLCGTVGQAAPWDMHSPYWCASDQLPASSSTCLWSTWWLLHLGLHHPSGRPGWSSWSLALAGCSLQHCGLLGSEPVNDGSSTLSHLSLSLSLSVMLLSRKWIIFRINNKRISYDMNVRYISVSSLQLSIFIWNNLKINCLPIIPRINLEVNVSFLLCFY